MSPIEMVEQINNAEGRLALAGVRANRDGVAGYVIGWTRRQTSGEVQLAVLEHVARMLLASKAPDQVFVCAVRAMLERLEVLVRLGAPAETLRSALSDE